MNESQPSSAGTRILIFMMMQVVVVTVVITLFGVRAAADDTLGSASDLPSRRLLARFARRSWQGSEAVEGTGAAAGATGIVRELRITRGLGRFAGDDFPCAERDAHIGASWSKGACLMLCRTVPNAGNAPSCEHAKQVCRDHAADGCRTVDINVEGTVATLKRETELSQRTSWVKDIKVTRNQGRRGSNSDTVDRPCQEANAKLPWLAKGAACTLRCPRLDCSRGIELCYAHEGCVGVDLTFNVVGHPAIARLRYRGAGVDATHKRRRNGGSSEMDRRG